MSTATRAGVPLEAQHYVMAVGAGVNHGLAVVGPSWPSHP
jgi:hypothetical protein